MYTVLIVDDEANIRRMLGSLLRSEGFQVREADSAASGVGVALEAEPDVVLLDLVMPGRTGLDALPELAAGAPDLPVVMMSGRASLSDAVSATKLGAFHFLEKPLTPEAVLLTLRSALELRRTRAMNRALQEELGHRGRLVGVSAAMDRVREMISRLAPTDARVLITGESGTGKELAASALHQGSSRAQGPFVRVNCAAIPRDLVESELFGHERGAFTGANERRRGRFEMADGGSLLLDEVGELSLEAQAKLLRVLEAGEIERVGGTRPLPVDVRTIAATNRDLQADVRTGRFREDLFFRLHVVPLEMPPLRTRREDIPLLVEHFLRLQREKSGIRPPRVTEAAVASLQEHPWPGNVRELANIVERVTILHPGEEVGGEEVNRLLEGFPPNEAKGNGAGDAGLADRLDDYERKLIMEALDTAEGNIAAAARRLCTDRANLYRRMRRLEIPR
ncbi:MAG: response regulator [Gemmatimonas sp.]|nr:response regulator [Gemmatimonas sp.]